MEAELLLYRLLLWALPLEALFLTVVEPSVMQSLGEAYYTIKCWHFSMPGCSRASFGSGIRSNTLILLLRGRVFVPSGPVCPVSLWSSGVNCSLFNWFWSKSRVSGDWAVAISNLFDRPDSRFLLLAWLMSVCLGPLRHWPALGLQHVVWLLSKHHISVWWLGKERKETLNLALQNCFLKDKVTVSNP